MDSFTLLMCILKDLFVRIFWLITSVCVCKIYFGFYTAFIKCDLIFPPAFFFLELFSLSEVSLCPVFCVSAAFSTTGFDRHTSLVFNPANPETSVEDCLAAVGDHVVRELDTHLAEAVHRLFEGSALVILYCFEIPLLSLLHMCGSVQQLHYSGWISIFTLSLYSMRNISVPAGCEEWQSQCWYTAAFSSFLLSELLNLNSDAVKWRKKPGLCKID